MESFKNKIISKHDVFQTKDIESLQANDKQNILFSDPLPTLKEAEEILIAEALKRADGNQTIAAQLLGMTRKALNNRLIRSKK